MSEPKFKSGDVAMIDQGNGTVHAYTFIELTDGTHAWRDLGILKIEDNPITHYEENAGEDQ